jgi:hypothetical protein
LEKFQEILGPYGNILPHGRKYHQFRVCKLDELVVILPKIIPHLITKKKRSKIVFQWCKSRLENWHKHYSNKELQIYENFVECE